MDKLRVSIMMTISTLPLPSRSLRVKGTESRVFPPILRKQNTFSVLASSLLHLEARSEISGKLFLLTQRRVSGFIFTVSFVLLHRKGSKDRVECVGICDPRRVQSSSVLIVLIVWPWYPECRSCSSSLCTDVVESLPVPHGAATGSVTLRYSGVSWLWTASRQS